MSKPKCPPVVNDDPAMAGERARTQGGTLRQKRHDTHVGTVEKKYGVDFGVRSDMHLGTLLKQEKAGSLSQLLKKKK